MKPAKCPFYPDSCTVEFHPNMQHVWRKGNAEADRYDPKDQTTLGLPDYSTPEQCARDLRSMKPTEPITNITNKASERAQAWNKANRKQYNARQKLLMTGKRAKRGT